MNRIGWTKKKATIALALCAIIAVSSFMFLQTSPTTQAALIDPHPGLVGWWRFDEGTGTIAGDSSGNGNNGNINGATWTAGQYGQALNFNGINNKINCVSSSSLNVANAITIEIWLKQTAYVHTAGLVYKAGQYSLWTRTDSAIYSGVFVDGAFRTVYPLFYPALGQWYHYAMTYDSVTRTINCYINGVQQTPTVLSGLNSYTIATSSNPLNIGYNPDYNTWFNGALDEIRVFNRALSATEIQQDSQQNPDFSSNLLAKVPMGTTQVIFTLSWQGTGSINATIVSPSSTYTESTQPVYQKTTYSTSDGLTSMLNIKRISVPVTALPSDQNWNVNLAFDNPVPYQITVEVQK